MVSDSGGVGGLKTGPAFFLNIHRGFRVWGDGVYRVRVHPGRSGLLADRDSDPHLLLHAGGVGGGPVTQAEDCRVSSAGVPHRSKSGQGLESLGFRV